MVAVTKGKRPKPTEIKRREGAFRKDPQRENKREPVPPAGAPAVPSALRGDKQAKDEWVELCGWLESMGLLATTDRTLMQEYCATYSEYCRLYKDVRKNGISYTTEKTGAMHARPEVHQYNQVANRLLRLCAELGLTPSARSRMVVPDGQHKGDVDPFLTLVDRMKHG